MSKKPKYKIGDKITCICCGEVNGTINKIYIKEKVGVIPYPYTGYSVIDVNGYETVCTFDKAIKLKTAKILYG